LICVISFSVAIPLLAALVVVDRPQAVRRERMAGALVFVAQVVAQWSAFTSVVAGFWHITWVARVGVLPAGSWARRSSR
jgi:predicted metal-binding membrane protein